MNKLKNKIFLTLSIILTIFLITILFIFNFQNYKQEEIRLKDILSRVENINNKDFKPSYNNPKPEESRKFIDSLVYTIKLENDEIVRIESHTFDDYDPNIEEYVKSIIKKKENSFGIMSLYFSKYSYIFKNETTMLLVDNTRTQTRLLSLLKTSIIIFILLEVIILFLSYKLTKWIIKPVLESFNKQKQFIADASHELKTPISVILANAEMAGLEPKNKKWLDNIKNESIRMNKLITNLLDLAKIENNIKEKKEIIDLSKLVEMSILPFESLAYENNLKLKYDIEENITLSCVPTEMKQLIAILVDNAIKHSYKNSEIKINLSKSKRDITISVQNNGKEIKKDQIERIFERFYRIDESRNRNNNRYGLGLSIAKEIVKNHQGKIEVKSTPEHTTFVVTFKQVLN